VKQREGGPGKPYDGEGRRRKGEEGMK